MLRAVFSPSYLPRRLAALACALSCVLLSTPLSAAESCTDPVARVVSLQGQVDLSVGGQGAWHPVAVGRALCPGDVVTVRAQGRAAVVFAGDVLTRLDQLTTLQVAAPPKAGDAALGLREGIAHFISRLKKRVEVISPVVNALVEGTEFTVAAHAGEGRVVVAEGRVRASNAAGEQVLRAGESVAVSAGQAPRRIDVRPLDAVQWAIHYPVLVWPARLTDGGVLPANVIEARRLALRARYAEALAQVGEMDDPVVRAYRANLLLALGRVDQALALVDALGDAAAPGVAVRAAIAVANNAPQRAATLAAQALALDAGDAAAHLANSYALQSRGALDGALAAAAEATLRAPENPVAWARRAELALSLSQLADARRFAQHALTLDEGTLRARAMLGFAHLLAGDLTLAAGELSAAIEADPADPLARFAHGLTQIRQGRLAAGRRDLELAVLLDPSNGEYRATLGRAYMGEARDARAATQLQLAREIAPASPTAWFFSAQRRLLAGDVLGAIDDGEQALARNEARLNLRASALLDIDRAARGAALASAYQRAGFDHALTRVAADAVEDDGAGAAAHEAMAQAYGDDRRLEAARVSEQFQRFVFGALGQSPVAPQDLLSAPPILNGPRVLSLDETAALFEPRTSHFAASAIAGTQETWGTSVMASTQTERAQAAVGHFDYRSDGFQPDGDVDLSATRGEFRLQLSDAMRVFADMQHKDFVTRDITQSFFTNVDSAIARERSDVVRVGLHTAPSATTSLVAVLGSESGRTVDATTDTLSVSFPFVAGNTAISTETDIARRELALRLDGAGERTRYTLGMTVLRGVDAGTQTENTALTVTNFFPPPATTTFTTTTPRSFRMDTRQHSLFGRLAWRAQPGLKIDSGLDYVDYTQTGVRRTPPPSALVEQLDARHTERLLPSLGATVDGAGTTWRAALIQGVSLDSVGKQSIAPTRFGGFDNRFDDPAGTRYRRLALGFDRPLGGGMRVGGAWSLRKLDVPNALCGVDCLRRWNERRHHLFFNTALSSRVGAEIAWRYESLGLHRVPLSGGFDRPVQLRTETLPLRLFVQLPPNWQVLLEALKVRQDVVNLSPSALTRAHAGFWMANARVAYAVPGGAWRLGLEVRNLFDQRALIQDTDLLSEDPRTPLWYPERAVFVSARVAF